MDILQKLAGNKSIAQLAFKQIKKYIKEENISMIVIYIDNDGNIAAKQYSDPMVIVKQEDYLNLLNKSKSNVQP